MVSDGSFSSLMVLFLSINPLVIAISAELERFDQPPKDDGSLSLLVIGDWGRNGHFNQSKVALQMGRIGEKLDIDFVISTGDNFYENGLKDVHDPEFETSFTNIYTSKSLKKHWYSILGNHDYRGDAEAPLSFIKLTADGFAEDLLLLTRVSFEKTAEFFFVDTTPFVKRYFIEKEHTYDWRRVSPRGSYIANLLKDLERALKESIAKWKIVVGHHAIRSVGHHGDTPELVQKLLPLLEANDVDFYINGHDHSLEHISSSNSPIQFLTSGAGSKAWRGDIRPIKKKEPAVLKFFYDGQGFMSLQLSLAEAEFAFYDVFGKVLHTWKVSKHPYAFI